MSSKQLRDDPAVLTIAGFDPSGGAGVIADIRTFLAFDCRPFAAITSLTLQNSTGVSGATHQTWESLRAQVLTIIGERGIAAAKTGMLPTREIVLEVARLFRKDDLPAPVVDPVLRSSSGYLLMEDDAIEVLISELMPLARLITPNIPEAERLTGLRIEDEDGMREAAHKLRGMGALAVLVKGGHLKQWAVGSGQWAEGQEAVGSGKRAEGQRAVGSGKRAEGQWAVGSGQWAEKAEAIDVLDDHGSVTVFRGDWIEAPPVRGTGCMLSAAIAASLGKGMNLLEAVGAAKSFVRDVIACSR